MTTDGPALNWATRKGSTMALRYYIDPQGYAHNVVDNGDALEFLNPKRTVI
ncbi:hypothetical protein GCM10027167_64320 [Nocardia heshunensis]